MICSYPPVWEIWKGAEFCPAGASRRAPDPSIAAAHGNELKRSKLPPGATTLPVQVEVAILPQPCSRLLSVCWFG